MSVLTSAEIQWICVYMETYRCSLEIAEIAYIRMLESDNPEIEF